MHQIGQDALENKLKPEKAEVSNTQNRSHSDMKENLSHPYNFPNNKVS